MKTSDAFNKRVRVVDYTKAFKRHVWVTMEVGLSTTSKCHMFESLDGGGLTSKYWGHVVVHHLLKFIKKKICFREVVKNSI
jgi:hypothetical protein